MRSLRFPLMLAAVAVTGIHPSAARPLNVVASVANLGSIASEVGGDRVKVTTIASGVQDAHFVDPKPSFIVRLRSADFLLINGLDLEIGWIPPLTQGARNSRILVGADGYIDCSSRISVMEIPSGPVSRAQGDVHPYGNPHYLTDPLNAEIVALQLAEAFSRESPGDATYFDQRAADFIRRLHAAVFGEDLVDLVGGAKLARMARTGELIPYLRQTELGGEPLIARLGGWMGRMLPHAGARIVTYHRDYSYFANRFGLEVVAYVEPKPGIPPSSKHLVELTERIQRGDVKLLVTRPFVEHRSTDRIAETTGIPILNLPLEAGTGPDEETYLQLMNRVVTTIASTLDSR